MTRNEQGALDRRAMHELAEVVASLPDAVFTSELGGTVLTWNRGAERLYGVTASEAVGRRFRDVVHDGAVPGLIWIVDEIREGRPVRDLETQVTRPDGVTVDIQVTVSPVRNAAGKVDRMATVMRDVTAIKGVQRELAQTLADLRRAAYRDALTGLGTRMYAIDQIEQLEPGARDVTVVLADIDNFQYFNSTLGQQVGDEVLITVAGLIRDLVGEDEILVRVGGDEFAVVTWGRGPERGREIATTLQRRLHRPVTVGERELTVTVSTGVASVSQMGPGTTDLLLRRAALAQAEAAAAGHNLWRSYDPGMEVDFIARNAMEERLRTAIGTGGQFTVAYQPLCLADTGEIVEVEALLRWNDTELGSVSPADFIPVAEYSGAIVPLGEWVLRQACEDMMTLASAGVRPQLNVNVSPRQIVDPGFGGVVRRALSDSGLPAEQLILEVTETAISSLRDALAKGLESIADLGVGLAVDDFGTGHSSLARLHALPFTVLKIDKSMIDEIVLSRRNSVIVEAVLGMARGLGLVVVAEGVECEQQLDRLRELGCDLIQGFLLHRPMPLDELRAALQSQHDAAPGDAAGHDAASGDAAGHDAARHDGAQEDGARNDSAARAR